MGGTSAGSLITSPAALHIDLLTGLLIPFCLKNLIAGRNGVHSLRPYILSPAGCVHLKCDFLLVIDDGCDLYTFYSLNVKVSCWSLVL